MLLVAVVLVHLVAHTQHRIKVPIRHSVHPNNTRHADEAKLLESLEHELQSLLGDSRLTAPTADRSFEEVGKDLLLSAAVTRAELDENDHVAIEVSFRIEKDGPKAVVFLYDPVTNEMRAHVPLLPEVFGVEHASREVTAPIDVALTAMKTFWTADLHQASRMLSAFNEASRISTRGQRAASFAESFPSIPPLLEALRLGNPEPKKKEQNVMSVVFALSNEYSGKFKSFLQSFKNVSVPEAIIFLLFVALDIVSTVIFSGKDSGLSWATVGIIATIFSDLFRLTQLLDVPVCRKEFAPTPFRSLENLVVHAGLLTVSLYFMNDAALSSNIEIFRGTTTAFQLVNKVGAGAANAAYCAFQSSFQGLSILNCYQHPPAELSNPSTLATVLRGEVLLDKVMVLYAAVRAVEDAMRNKFGSENPQSSMGAGETEATGATEDEEAVADVPGDDVIYRNLWTEFERLLTPLIDHSVVVGTEGGRVLDFHFDIPKEQETSTLEMLSMTFELNFNMRQVVKGLFYRGFSACWLDRQRMMAPPDHIAEILRHPCSPSEAILSALSSIALTSTVDPSDTTTVTRPDNSRICDFPQCSVPGRIQNVLTKCSQLASTPLSVLLDLACPDVFPDKLSVVRAMYSADHPEAHLFGNRQKYLPLYKVFFSTVLFNQNPWHVDPGKNADRRAYMLTAMQLLMQEMADKADVAIEIAKSAFFNRATYEKTEDIVVAGHIKYSAVASNPYFASLELYPDRTSKRNLRYPDYLSAYARGRLENKQVAVDIDPDGLEFLHCYASYLRVLAEFGGDPTKVSLESGLPCFDLLTAKIVRVGEYWKRIEKSEQYRNQNVKEKTEFLAMVNAIHPGALFELDVRGQKKYVFLEYTTFDLETHLTGSVLRADSITASASDITHVTVHGLPFQPRRPTMSCVSPTTMVGVVSADPPWTLFTLLREAENYLRNFAPTYVLQFRDCQTWSHTIVNLLAGTMHPRIQPTPMAAINLAIGTAKACAETTAKVCVLGCKGMMELYEPVVVSRVVPSTIDTIV